MPPKYNLNWANSTAAVEKKCFDWWNENSFQRWIRKWCLSNSTNFITAIISSRFQLNDKFPLNEISFDNNDLLRAVTRFCMMVFFCDFNYGFNSTKSSFFWQMKFFAVWFADKIQQSQIYQFLQIQIFFSPPLKRIKTIFFGSADFGG